MMHHDENGAIAVMLNRPIWPPPTELIKMITGEGQANAAEDDEQDSIESKSPTSTNRLKKLVGPLDLSVPVSGDGGTIANPVSSMIHFGGPLSGPVLAIHGSQTLAEAQTGQGIYVAAQKDHLEQLLRENSSEYRLIIGHSAWGSGQLDAEIEAGVWHVLPATAELIFGTADDLWPLLIRRATGATLARLVGAPDNPWATALN